ncbi:unnamed protein product [Parascedosporium putredinis]|uniref:Glyoxalase/fosfomycin resistance/dioxygenase domain-containing protein n=1 Tax=Parascedosporium putredinis TaxID=1442378 RepID=A0A9P1H2G3_9PEZI|nr:unnamed protein product [Parascedosporium putredinis]CAI7993578.1 unnamed protein product [Parascedosporium putredinis]
MLRRPWEPHGKTMKKTAQRRLNFSDGVLAFRPHLSYESLFIDTRFCNFCPSNTHIPPTIPIINQPSLSCLKHGHRCSPTFFLNIHTKDLAAATAFFQAIGFTHLTHWSDDKSSSFTLPAPNQNVALMIHTHARYKDFIRPGNTLADPKTSSQALFSIGAKTKEEVDEALQRPWTPAARRIRSLWRVR